MLIALCEDHALDLARLKSSIERYLSSRSLSATLATYDNPTGFLSGIGRWNVPQINFLDIYMAGESGVELARRIRAMDERAVIIFVTSSMEHMADGFDVGAAHYLVKPFTDDQLDQAMNRALMMVDEPEQYLNYACNRREEHLEFSEILYLEARNKHCHIFTTSGDEFIASSTMSALSTQLTDPRFLCCHRSFIVNMDHIRGVGRDDFIMKGGQLVPIRTRPRAETLEHYESYRFRRIRRRGKG